MTRAAVCVWLALCVVPACSDDPPTQGTADTSGGDTAGAPDTNRDDASEGDAHTDPADARAEPDAPDFPPDTPEDVAPDSDGSPDVTPACPLAEASPEGPRTILLGHPFGAEVATDGTEIRTLELGTDGAVVDVGLRIDVGFVPARIAFSPDGRYAYVLGDEGDLASLAVAGPGDVVLIDSIALPRADYGDLRVHPDGITLTVVGSNVDSSSGVSVVAVSCDKPSEGTLTELPAAFLNIRLSDSLVLLGHNRGLLLGGQAVFDPIDADDIRLLDFTDRSWTVRATFDIFTDFVGATRIAASPDGTQALIPNDIIFSDEGGKVSVLSLSADEVTEVDRIGGLPDATEALYSHDGRVALLTQTEPGRVKVLARQGDSMELTGQEFRVGVAQQMASVERGPLAGVVLIPATSPTDGPELVVLRVDGDTVTEAQRLPLGRGYANIPRAIAIQP